MEFFIIAKSWKLKEPTTEELYTYMMDNYKDLKTIFQEHSTHKEMRT